MARYDIEVCGNCLGDWLPNGTSLVADTEAEVAPLSVVSIVIRDGEGPWARWMRSTGEESRAACKMFLGWLDAPEGGRLMVGQLNPPVVSLIAEAEIEALHKVTGVVGRQGGVAGLTENDRAALDLIAPFCNGVSMRPINRAWRPVSEPERLQDYNQGREDQIGEQQKGDPVADAA